jgi:4-hydroxy-tetrahydrodipicolinate reductase
MPETRQLAIVGYGKMGRMIEQFAPEYGFSVALKLDEFNNANFVGVTAENFRGIDVAIDFSIPAAVRRNVESIAALGVNLVVGTTGWLEHVEAVKQAVETNGIGLVWSPNYSVGVNVFFRLVREAARLLEAQPAYGAWGWEIHHAAKKDAPSGTLLKLVEEMKRAGYTRPAQTPAHTKSVSILPPTPSPCAIPPEAAKGLPAARCRPRSGSSGRKGFMSSETLYSAKNVSHE